MFSHKMTARIVGVLFIVASAAAVAGGGLIDTVLDDSNMMANLAGHEGRVVTGAILELVLAVSVFAIATMIYPVLRRHGEGLALSYVGMRILEGVIIVVGTLSALVLLTLSQDYAQALAGGSQPLVEMLLGVREWVGFLGPMVVFALSALILYAVLYQAKLVPAWLSIWGLIGGVLLLVRGVLAMFGQDPSTALSVVITAPIGINEMVLAVWLIVKGFSSPGITIPVESPSQIPAGV